MMNTNRIGTERLNKNHGFTLIEVIAALIVLGIMSVVVISRVTSTADVNLKAQAEVVKSHLRYAQLRAMNMKSEAADCNAAFGIKINAAEYYLFRDCDPINTSNTVVLPGAAGTTVYLPGMTLSPQIVTFDDWGRPCKDQFGKVLATDDISIGNEIKITKNTGFVP